VLRGPLLAQREDASPRSAHEIGQQDVTAFIVALVDLPDHARDNRGGGYLIERLFIGWVSYTPYGPDLGTVRQMALPTTSG
jgi:hypothetical protein